MSKSYPIFGTLQNPAVDRPLFYANRTKMEIGIKTGAFERIDDSSARIITLPSAQKPEPEPWSEANNWFKNAHAPVIKCCGACQICGFSRFVEKCHIIPARFDGQAEPSNLLELCPNHHTLFDRNLLTWPEMQKIWPSVQEGMFKSLADHRLDEMRELMKQRYGVTFEAN